MRKTSPEIKRDKSKPAQMDLFPLWHTRSRGLSLALRSWGVPKGTEFGARTEENLQQIGTEHRRIARLWPAWLRSVARGATEIWTGWREVRLPGTDVIPDGLAWGRIQGYETLFWLEVGDGHKSRDKITEITTRRPDQAWEFCERTGEPITRQPVKSRLSAEIGHLGSLNRSAERVMASLVDWGMLSHPKKENIYNPKIKAIRTENLKVQNWLLACALLAHPANELPFPDLIRLPELFPFYLSITLDSLRSESRFSIYKHGTWDMISLNVQVEISKS